MKVIKTMLFVTFRGTDFIFKSEGKYDLDDRLVTEVEAIFLDHGFTVKKMSLVEFYSDNTSDTIAEFEPKI